MKIKDYKCKCGHNDFFFADKGNQKGIYCSYCGKWLKWADKDEQNLTIKQEPRWIPTSERLPEEDGEYLATIYDMDENHEYMDIAELEDGKWCYKPYILVKAWMPLPTSYQGEKNE